MAGRDQPPGAGLVHQAEADEPTSGLPCAMARRSPSRARDRPRSQVTSWRDIVKARSAADRPAALRSLSRGRRRRIARTGCGGSGHDEASRAAVRNSPAPWHGYRHTMPMRIGPPPQPCPIRKKESGHERERAGAPVPAGADQAVSVARAARRPGAPLCRRGSDRSRARRERAGTARRRPGSDRGDRPCTPRQGRDSSRPPGAGNRGLRERRRFEAMRSGEQQMRASARARRAR
jgi:hypothetical protein